MVNDHMVCIGENFAVGGFYLGENIKRASGSSPGGTDVNFKTLYEINPYFKIFNSFLAPKYIFLRKI